MFLRKAHKDDSDLEDDDEVSESSSSDSSDEEDLEFDETGTAVVSERSQRTKPTSHKESDVEHWLEDQLHWEPDRPEDRVVYGLPPLPPELRSRHSSRRHSHRGHRHHRHRRDSSLRQRRLDIAPKHTDSGSSLQYQRMPATANRPVPVQFNFNTIPSGKSLQLKPYNPSNPLQSPVVSVNSTLRDNHHLHQRQHHHHRQHSSNHESNGNLYGGRMYESKPMLAGYDSTELSAMVRCQLP